MSQLYCCGVMLLASFAFQGHSTGFQTLVQHHKSIAFPLLRLDPVPPSAAEQEERVDKRPRWNYCSAIAANPSMPRRSFICNLYLDETFTLWSTVHYGIHSSDEQIVSVALSQLGNVGGASYWSCYGFESRVEWCACFVGWCANECCYIDSGVLPKFASCRNGMLWFQSRGQWLPGNAEPTPGMIVFFDWDDENGQDGLPDHVGIVQKAENGMIYTIEGNSGNACRIKIYPVGHYELLGFGIYR